MKLCRDCEHREGSHGCQAPENFVAGGPDYVYGGERTVRRYQSAQAARQDSQACGPEARWFVRIGTAPLPAEAAGFEVDDDPDYKRQDAEARLSPTNHDHTRKA